MQNLLRRSCASCPSMPDHDPGAAPATCSLTTANRTIPHLASILAFIIAFFLFVLIKAKQLTTMIALALSQAGTLK